MKDIKLKSKKNQHVIPANEKWAVKGESNSRRTKITKTKKEAVKRARQIAKNKKSELVIHNRDGKISDKDSYGNDHIPQRELKHYFSHYNLSTIINILLMKQFILLALVCFSWQLYFHNYSFLNFTPMFIVRGFCFYGIIF